MRFQRQFVTTTVADLQRVFHYLVDCIARLDSVGSVPRPDWRPLEKRVLKAIFAARGTLVAHTLPDARLVTSAIDAERKMWRSPTREAIARQTVLLWGACLAVPRIGGRNRYEFVREALRQKGIYWETAKIKMRIVRFERDLQRQKFTFNGKLGVLIELFDGFKRSEFRARNPNRLYLMRSDSRWLTGLTDEEIQIARDLLREC